MSAETEDRAVDEITIHASSGRLSRPGRGDRIDGICDYVAEQMAEFGEDVGLTGLPLETPQHQSRRTEEGERPRGGRRRGS